jgi:hypothetical protein
MDPILVAERLPRLGERAMRSAVAAATLRTSPAAARRVTVRILVDNALMRFERALQQVAADGVRPSLLFAERDRIVRELRAFAESRLSVRMLALRRRDVLCTGAACRPFDAVVRGRRGSLFAVALRRLPQDARQLDLMRRTRSAATSLHAGEAVRGVLLYDFTTATLWTVRCASGDAGTDRQHGDLGARGKLEFSQNVRDVVLDRFVAQVQTPADLLVREAFGHQLDHLELAL